jgi:hypothetical protein
LWQVKIES